MSKFGKIPVETPLRSFFTFISFVSHFHLDGWMLYELISLDVDVVVWGMAEGPKTLLWPLADSLSLQGFCHELGWSLPVVHTPPVFVLAVDHA